MSGFHRRIFPEISREFPGKFFPPEFPEISLGIFLDEAVIISTCQKTMPTNTKILELRKFFNIDDDKQWQQIWMDATKIYEAGISEVESSVKSCTK